jgi:hypothetical protein
MRKVIKSANQAGIVVGSELILISAILVLGLLVGFAVIRDSVIGELHDVAESYGELVQSHTYQSTMHIANSSSGADKKVNTQTRGSEFQDHIDDGDKLAYTVTVAAGDEDDL